MSLILFQADILTRGVSNLDETLPGRPTILLVDDDETVLEFVQTLLEGEGYQVLAAQDGEAGLRVYEQYQPEIALVVSDINMPTMNGVDLFYALRKRDPNVKFIAISGYVVPDSVAQMKEDGLLEIIRKPFSIESLLNRVKKLLA